MKETLLLIAAALCVFFILFQLIKGVFLDKRYWRKRHPIVDAELEALCQKADNPAHARNVLREIDTLATQQDAKRRAVYYTAAGEVALTRLKRPNVAIRYYFRALRNNPKCEPAFDRMAEILVAQKKLRRFKLACWYLLSRMDEEDTGETMWRKCWSGLATVYASHPRFTMRADAIRKMLAGMESEVDDDDLDDLEELDDHAEDNCNGGAVPRIVP